MVQHLCVRLIWLCGWQFSTSKNCWLISPDWDTLLHSHTNIHRRPTEKAIPKVTHPNDRHSQCLHTYFQWICCTLNWRQCQHSGKRAEQEAAKLFGYCISVTRSLQSIEFCCKDTISVWINPVEAYIQSPPFATAAYIYICKVKLTLTLCAVKHLIQSAGQCI